MGKLTAAVKPSDIKIDKDFMDTFGDNDIEVIARNIVIISKKNGDQWQPFTFDDYVRLCSHGSACNEQGMLNVMAQKGFLQLQDGKYSVCDVFIGRLAAYLKQSE